MAMSHWQVSDLEYLDSSDASVLAFHSPYPEGKQGGVEIIHHDVRIATNGDLRIEAAPGQWGYLPKFISRSVDKAAAAITASLAFNNLPYTINLAGRDQSFTYGVSMKDPLPAELVGKIGLNMEFFAPTYRGRSWQLDGACGVFPYQGQGPTVRDSEGRNQPSVMASGKRLVLAAEDSLRTITIEALDGELMLMDARQVATTGWIVVRSLVPAGKSKDAVRWLITPGVVPSWRRTPVIGVSQVGYHPGQAKRAIIELDKRETKLGVARLLKVQGQEMQEVKTAPVTRWGEFLRYQYAVLDFTDARADGVYFVEYEGQRVGPFRISKDIYAEGVWQPTLDTWFPVQMCHVRVEEGSRVWHGACHLDDAKQAPAPHQHFDGYRQGDTTGTPFAPGEHVPFMDQGGWHDAGDYDLAAGSQAETTSYLALAAEEFNPDRDLTTVQADKHLVVIGKPDGVPDIIQQIVHGVQCLLGGYRACGRTLTGIIEGNMKQYTHMGDAATITDNVISDDDRWVFTDHDTSLEYKVAASLAVASRVLRAHDKALADECLAAAVKAWDFEQSHPPVAHHSAYIPQRPEQHEVSATTELLLTTGQEKYRKRLIELLPTITANIAQLGWFAVRAMDHVKDAAFSTAIAAAMKEYSSALAADVAKTPYNVPYHVSIWGIGWGLQVHAVRMYYLAKLCPDMFDAEHVLAIVNWVLGCHPGSNVSFVSGAGVKSLTIAFGTSRADWSYIPGGVASGTNFIEADFPECKDDTPFLWQQSEYVVHGSATYIFSVLGGEYLLNR